MVTLSVSLFCQKIVFGNSGHPGIRLLSSICEKEIVYNSMFLSFVF